MGETVLHDLYELARRISVYLPLSEGLTLDKEVFNVVNNVPIRKVQGEHWAVISKTGNGKTTFDKALIRAMCEKMPWINTYICDSKKQGDFTERDGKIWRTYEPPPVLTGVGEKQVWQPIVDDINAYDAYCTNILQAGKPAIVLFDESKNLKFGNKAPKGYELLLAQGRLPGIHTITNYQEVANGLRQGLSQPNHVVAFSVWNPYDERMVKTFLRLPTDKPLPLRGKHSLLYINRDRMGAPTLFSGYKEFIQAFKNW